MASTENLSNYGGYPQAGDFAPGLEQPEFVLDLAKTSLRKITDITDASSTEAEFSLHLKDNQIKRVKGHEIKGIEPSDVPGHVNLIVSQIDQKKGIIIGSTILIAAGAIVGASVKLINKKNARLKG